MTGQTRPRSYRGRLAQDRRRFARTNVLLECGFSFEGKTSRAVIIDLSLNGVLLSSDFLPPQGANIVLTIGSPHLKKPLSLAAHVLEGNWVLAGAGKIGRFRVRFGYAPPELLILVNALASRRVNPRIIR